MRSRHSKLGDVPSPSKHWKLAVAKGPDVAGRSTNVVTATDPKTREARLKVYVDRDTGVMLRREVLDHRGESVRSVGFVEVKKLGGARSAAPATPKAKNVAPKQLVSVPKGYDAPERIGTRYTLVGMRLGPYVLATLIGILPGTVVFASVGNGLGHLFESGGTPDFAILLEPQILLPMLALAALSLAPVLYRRWKGRSR